MSSYNIELPFIILFAVLGILCSCGSEEKKETVVSSDPLPILGEKQEINGAMVYHEIPEFIFLDQYGDSITPETFQGQAYVVDYFFTSCPTICPKVKEQELRIFERFKGTNILGLLSVSIDPKYDDVERLKWYADRLEIPKSDWHFVTGDKDFIYEVANDFFHIAIEDSEAPGGFNHDGRLVLIDKNKHIRSFCNGLDEQDVERFIQDIEKLLNEK